MTDGKKALPATIYGGEAERNRVNTRRKEGGNMERGKGRHDWKQNYSFECTVCRVALCQ